MQHLTDFSALAHAYEGEHGLEEFRVQTITTLATAIAGLAFVLLWSAAIWPPTTTMEPLPIVAALGLVSGLTWASLRRGSTLALIVMSLGLTATLSVLTLARPGGAFPAAMCVVVMAASGAGRLRHGLAAAVMTTVALGAIDRLAPGAIDRSTLVLALLLIWSTLVIAWLSSRRLAAVVGWSWRSYALAQEKTEEARTRQMELGHLSKSLNETVEKLARLNVELRDARQAADQARELKAAFAATVGHELRTPINLIIGFSELMIGQRHAGSYDQSLPESFRGDLEAIYRNACHISQLVDDILDLSQVDAHRMALHKAPTAIADVVREAVAAVEILCAEMGLTVSLQLPSDLPKVSADPVRVRQVLINLMYNSIRFTNRGGLTIAARATSADLVVSVADTGVGIPAGDLPTIFEEFRQAHDRGRGGSGLGLAVCRRFVELHGGSIWAESTPGVGSTFSFSLPRQDQVVAVPARRDPLPLDGHTRPARRVAVLDHSGETARVLRRYLDRHEIKRVETPAQARRAIVDESVSALILSSATAEVEWREFIRGRDDHMAAVAATPTITCTLRTRDTIAESLGLVDYLVKPVTRDQLVGTLRRFKHRPQKVVVIDDDVEMGQLVSRLVRSHAHRCQVLYGRDGDVGLQLVREHRPDLVLLDLLMPVMDGFRVLERLRADEELRDTPVIVISARGADEEVLASRLEITRPDGLSVGETVSCLRACLDALDPLGGGTAPAPTVASRA